MNFLALLSRQKLFNICHSGESRSPIDVMGIPACAGMTNLELETASAIIILAAGLRRHAISRVGFRDIGIEPRGLGQIGIALSQAAEAQCGDTATVKK